MDKKQTTKDNDKIILPKNLQREMIRFFLTTSIPKIAADKEQQQKPPYQKDRGGING